MTKLLQTMPMVNLMLASIVLQPVPGPGTTPAGGGCAEPGERSGTHRRRVLQPGPRAAPAGATREMLAGSRGKPGGAVAEARAFAVAAAAAPARTAGSGYRRAAP